MREGGPLPLEGLVDEHMHWRARQPLFATDHMRNAHEVIVHDVGEVVSGHAVALEEHLVIDVGAVYHHPSTYDVLEAHLGVARHFQPDHVFIATRQTFLHFVGT